MGTSHPSTFDILEDRQYRKAVESSSPVTLNNTKTGRPCGGEAFIEELERIPGETMKRGQRGGLSGESRKSKSTLPFPD